MNRGPNSELIGILMLLVPLASSMLIWFWVGAMNLLQGPGAALSLLGIGTVVLTAALVAVEAQRLGVGAPTDKNVHGVQRSGPVTWLFAALLLWIICFPAWLYHRSKYGVKNLLAAGILVVLIFTASWAMMESAVASQQQKVHHIFQPANISAQESASPSASNGLLITLAKYDQIHDGMSYAQVCSVLGAQGNELSRSEMQGYQTAMYAWSNDDGSNVSAMFQNGKLMSKAQFGLQ